MPSKLKLCLSCHKSACHVLWCVQMLLQAIAELWIHLGVPPAGFTKEHYGRLFSFQLQQQSTK